LYYVRYDRKIYLYIPGRTLQQPEEDITIEVRKLFLKEHVLTYKDIIGSYLNSFSYDIMLDGLSGMCDMKPIMLEYT